MYHISHDKRARESSTWIFEALITLTKQTAYDKITVTALCEAAKIGRVTFYRHFDCIDDVLRWQCDQHLLLFVDYFQQLQQKTEPTFFIEFMRFWANRPEILHLIFQAERSFIIEESLNRILTPLEQPVTQNQSYTESQTLQGIRNAICLAILKQWLAQSPPLEPEQLVQLLLAQLELMLKRNQH